MTRDLALILLAAFCVLAAGVLVGLGHPGASIAPLIGVGSFALGRLGPPTDPAPLPDEVKP